MAHHPFAGPELTDVGPARTLAASSAQSDFTAAGLGIKPPPKETRPWVM